MSKDVGLQLERLIKRFKPYTEIRVVDNHGKVYVEDMVGNLLGGKYKYNGSGFLNRNQPYMRYQIKEITIDDNDIITIELDEDNLEIKHHSQYYYDDEFISLAKKKWSSMWDRTTSGRDSAYDDVSVCKEWKDVDSFVEWFKENWVDYDGTVCLDKDLLVVNNKEYNPDNCCLIPYAINMAIKTPNTISMGGVISYEKDHKSWKVRFTADGKRYDTRRTTKELAIECYFERKDKAIKELAEKYKNNISSKVYEVLLTYNSKERFIAKFGRLPN